MKLRQAFFNFTCMAFKLQNIVPWGRNLNEYIKFFNLTDIDLNKRILSVADGPASVNAELTKLGKHYISYDPIYQFSKKDIKKRIDDTADLIKIELIENKDNFVWKEYENPDKLFNKRLKTMGFFLNDLENGLEQQRYIVGELPKLPFKQNKFDLVLCSHFLFLYTEQFNLENHILSITEMLRVGKEIRIFPLLDLDAKKSTYLNKVIDQFCDEGYKCKTIDVPYEFQIGGNEMLSIKNIS